MVSHILASGTVRRECTASVIYDREQGQEGWGRHFPGGFIRFLQKKIEKH